METPLSLDALRVLDAIEREGTFAAAAARLHRVPSAITYTMRNLETDLGVALFDRSGHRAVLTEAGHIVLERGRRMLAAGDALRATARGLGEGWEPSFTIAVNSMLRLDPILELVGALHADQPDIELRLTEEVLDGHWDALESGRADLAIGAHGTPPRGIAARAFGSPDWVFVAAPDHPASRLSNPVDPTDLEDATAILASDSARDRPDRSAGIMAQQRRITVPNLAWKLAAHRAGLGVGWAPRHRVEDDLATGRLCEITLTESRETEPLFIAWRRGPRGRALRWFIERLQSAELTDALLS